MTEKENGFSQILDLYKIFAEDNRTYNNIVWQFPTALLAANGVLISFLLDKSPWILLAISIINFAFIHAIFKLCHNQQAIIETLKNIEKTFVEKYPSQQKLMPNFGKHQHGIMKLKSSQIICWMLFSANCGLLSISILMVLKVIN